MQATGKYMAKWLGLSLGIGVIMGGLSTFFLNSLTFVTGLRENNSWIIIFLPLVGLCFSFLYTKYGKNAQGGNNLVVSQANGGEEKIPLRLIPLTLFGTIFTHLTGGSVGREGTAVQMGGSVADFFARFFKITGADREVLIASGMAAGFSSVFGTPLAGTVFALEVLIVGRIRTEALFPAFFAAFFGNLTTEILGVHHTQYLMGSLPELTWVLFIKLFFAGIIFGLVGKLFAYSIKQVKKFYGKIWPNPLLRNTLGGVVVVLLGILVTKRYLGLSTYLLDDAFLGVSHVGDFLGKLIFTVLSLGAGFQGGEVTPLFEIGATLGADLGRLLNVSLPFLAGLGYIGVFAAATNTPIACFIMGIELFGGDYSLYFFLVCVLAVLISGHEGIYSSQFFLREKITHGKTNLNLRKK